MISGIGMRKYIKVKVKVEPTACLEQAIQWRKTQIPTYEEFRIVRPWKGHWGEQDDIRQDSTVQGIPREHQWYIEIDQSSWEWRNGDEQADADNAGIDCLNKKEIHEEEECKT